MEVKIFKKYPKIYRINHKEANINFSKPYWVSEKLDGTNVQISKEGNKIFIGKRSCNIELTTNGTYSQFCLWVSNNYNQLIEIIPEGYILYGECIKGKAVGKTGNFKAIGKLNYDIKFPFVLFDIYDYKNNKWLAIGHAKYNLIIGKLKKMGAEFIEHTKKQGLNEFKKIKENLIKTKSQYGDCIIEGIVIKQYDPRATLKIKNESEFKPHKTKSPQIVSVVKSVITPVRIDKIKREINYKSIEQIGKLIGLIIQDAIEEEEDYLKEQGWKQFKKEFHKASVDIIKQEVLK